MLKSRPWIIDEPFNPISDTPSIWAPATVMVTVGGSFGQTHSTGWWHGGFSFAHDSFPSARLMPLPRFQRLWRS